MCACGTVSICSDSYEEIVEEGRLIAYGGDDPLDMLRRCEDARGKDMNSSHLTDNPLVLTLANVSIKQMQEIAVSPDDILEEESTHYMARTVTYVRRG